MYSKNIYYSTRNKFCISCKHYVILCWWKNEANIHFEQHYVYTKTWKYDAVIVCLVHRFAG